MAEKNSTSTAGVMHTSGPWDAFDDEIVARDDQHIADVPLCDGVDPTEWQANIHLIAAAPELLAVCRRFLEMYEDVRDSVGPSVRATLEQADRVVAKAEGAR